LIGDSEEVDNIVFFVFNVAKIGSGLKMSMMQYRFMAMLKFSAATQRAFENLE
jgi:hypothetical protein